MVETQTKPQIFQATKEAIGKMKSFDVDFINLWVMQDSANTAMALNVAAMPDGTLMRFQRITPDGAQLLGEHIVYVPGVLAVQEADGDHGIHLVSAEEKKNLTFTDAIATASPHEHPEDEPFLVEEPDILEVDPNSLLPEEDEDVDNKLVEALNEVEDPVGEAAAAYVMHRDGVEDEENLSDEQRNEIDAIADKFIAEFPNYEEELANIEDFSLEEHVEAFIEADAEAASKKTQEEVEIPEDEPDENPNLVEVKEPEPEEDMIQHQRHFPAPEAEKEPQIKIEVTKPKHHENRKDERREKKEVNANKRGIGYNQRKDVPKKRQTGEVSMDEDAFMAMLND